MDAPGADAWQMPNALGAIAALTGHAAGYADTVDLGLADVRWMLDEILAGRPTRSNFRSGGLTVCGLVPMRSVPHRVICLVGMDDGAFPRVSARDGDDVLARDPLIGERDPRSEDRQVLLDAIMAATEHLVITYTGADDRTNEPRPPCVPLGELLDTLDAMAVTATGARAHRCPRGAPAAAVRRTQLLRPGLSASARAVQPRPSRAGGRPGRRLPRSSVPAFIVGDLPELPVPRALACGTWRASWSPRPRRSSGPGSGFRCAARRTGRPRRSPIELDGLAAGASVSGRCG